MIFQHDEKNSPINPSGLGGFFVGAWVINECSSSFVIGFSR
jgi:hypothetical protein